ncbi:MAG: hypothetical protein IKK99_06145 [Oscillospiraceae bacterium]|nr:hypothetical protein [Oscillospiraceae bacterium]
MDIWLGAEDQYHRIKSKVFTIDEFTSKDIIELDKANLWGEIIADDVETVYDYRYIIKK